MRNIVALSGGLSSAWVALWAKEKIENPIFYFNDTKWEHEDLYRFLNDIETVLGVALKRDDDGRTPEEVFYDQSMLANNRVPLCSRVLKAERLQKYVEPGDVVFFGIGTDEAHRALRIKPIYEKLGVYTRFPLIEENVTREQVKEKIAEVGIKEPELYGMGFTHNNCSGGCVRSGKKQWAHLLRTLPEVYAERERVEREVGLYLGKKVSYLKDLTLSELRQLVKNQGELFDDDSDTVTECVGICSTEN